MSDAAVFVTFGANTSELEASLARMNAMLRQSTSELARLAREQAKAGESAQADFATKMLAAAEKVSAAKAQIRDFRSQIQALEGSAGNGAKGAIEALGAIGEGAHGAGLGLYLREFHALGDELSSGRYRNAESTFLNLTVTFLQSNAALIPYVAAAAAAAAAIGLIAFKAYEAQAALNGLRLDAAANGFQLTATAAGNLRDEIERLGGVNASGAESIAKPFLQMGAVGAQVAEMLAPAMKQIAQVMDGDVGKAAEDVAKRFTDLDGAGLKYVQTSRSITEAEKQHFAQLVASGQRMQAYSALVDFSTRSLNALRNETTLSAAEERDHARAAMLAASAGYSFADAQKMLESATAQAKANIEAETAAVNAHRAALLAASAAAENFASAMKAAFKVDTVGAGIKQTADEIERLKAGLAAAPAGATAATQEMSRALDIAQQKLKALTQQKSDPGGMGRDLLSQDNDALTHYDAVFRGSEQARLTGHIAMLHQMLANDELTTAQQFKLQQDLEASQKQIYDQTAKAGTKAAKDVLGANATAIATQIRQQEDLARATLEHITAQTKLKQLTPSGGESAAIAALKQEQAAVEALYAKELALAGLTAQKKNEIARQELAFNDQIAVKIQQAQEKAAEASLKAWDSATKEINAAFESQISGLLHGTTSWRQALQNVLATLTEDIVKFFANWALKAVENAALQIAANNQLTSGIVASLGLQQAAQAAASTTGIATTIANVVRAVTIDAGQTFAGVAAFLSPVMGPAALGPVAAAQAAVLAAVPSADIGMWSVPQDMLTMVHHNELIMPSAEAGAFRSMLSGGGGGGNGGAAGETHFHYSPNVQAMDASGVRTVLQNHGRLFAKEIAKQFNQPGLRPTY